MKIKWKGNHAISIRLMIMDQITRIAEQQGRTLSPLDDDLRLLESGLDSLCLAILVACLDDELELDPFAGDNEIVFPVTIGDFIRLYENAVV